jgi:hypothetical protein
MGKNGALFYSFELLLKRRVIVTLLSGKKQIQAVKIFGS